MKQKFKEECKIIQQNCTYTAETHHQMACSAKTKSNWLEVVPAIATAISGTLAASGVATNFLLPLTVVTAGITAATAILNPNKEYQDHLSAAKNFTALKHDARFLHDALSERLTEEAFSVAVENLHMRYAELLKITPPTDGDSFKKAQSIVQSGLHEPDRNELGEII